MQYAPNRLYGVTTSASFWLGGLPGCSHAVLVNRSPVGYQHGLFAGRFGSLPKNPGSVTALEVRIGGLPSPLPVGLAQYQPSCVTLFCLYITVHEPGSI